MNFESYFTKWTDTNTYGFDGPEASKTYNKASLSYKPGERTECIYGGYDYSEDQIHQLIESGKIDEISINMLCRLAASKYLTMTQMSLYSTLQGKALHPAEVKDRVNFLVNCGLIRLYVCKTNDNVSVKAYGISMLGERLARKHGVYVHKGLGFEGVKQRLAKEKAPYEEPENIQRIIQTNHLILTWLKNKVTFERFGFMETVRINGAEVADAIVRPTAVVRLDSENTLLVECIRRSPEWKEKLVDKIRRYNILISREDFWYGNNIATTAVPQLVFLGEDKAHNEEIQRELIQAGLFQEYPDFEPLFTYDKLLESHAEYLYTLNYGEPEWYQLPIRSKEAETAA